MENVDVNARFDRPNLPSLIFGSLLGAIVGIFVVMQIEPIFSMPNEFADYPIQPTTEYMVRYHAALRFMYSCNFAIYFAILGMGIGLLTGLCAGGRRRFAAMASSGFLGGVFGAIGGFLSGLSVAYAIQNSGRAIPFLGLQIEPIVQTTAMQCFVWAIVATGIGVGFCVATGRSIGKGLQMGFLAGCLVGVGYTLVEGICFPSANGFLVVPISTYQKLTWASLAGIAIGATNFYISRQTSANQTINTTT